MNYFPKFDGHTMIIPKRHLEGLKDETKQEVLQRNQMEKFAAEILQMLFPGYGIEIFLQYGPGSSSSQPHLH